MKYFILLPVFYFLSCATAPAEVGELAKDCSLVHDAKAVFMGKDWDLYVCPDSGYLLLQPAKTRT